MIQTKSNCDVLLVGYEDEENLGLRSMASFLVEKGIDVEILPCQNVSKEGILKQINKRNPKIIGFSLIFQRMIFDFAELIDYLRNNGVKSHFTIGGHFPTLEYEKILELLPGLDTVVRHEGELTLLDLYRHLKSQSQWSEIRGIAYRRNGAIEVTSPRPLIQDLNSLPFPVREDKMRDHRGVGVCSILASRGCYYDCSFCSVQEFYSGAPGPRRRSRSPSNVVKEMEQLFERGARIFIFKDDDFSMKSRTQQRWIDEFSYLLKESGLADQILWRISCRVDEVDRNMLNKLKTVGLDFLYLGIESGCEQGLKTCNKHYGVEDIYKTLDIIESSRINFEYGFMFFDPDTDLGSVKDNISFFETLCKDGRVVVHFTKMFPYVGTQIAHKLRAEGRLEGSIDSPDYRYKDARIDLLEAFFTDAFHKMLFEPEGLVNKLQYAKFDSVILNKFFSDIYDAKNYMKSVSHLTKVSNESILETMRLAADFIDDHDHVGIIKNWYMLKELAEQERYVQDVIGSEVDKLIKIYN
ncbi:MAG: radical SAM protein [Euryarchaeota archaeon]|jgi:radical SAM superfamily enzyme YgiQ (UPF0313 family)|uniref:Radical SAM n=1 Tax=Methanothrix harundinacea TaxID=301375 RepID=A0A101FU82_9EURY|nr:MAG: Radical SAM [Methanothrix harundinacea]MCP1392093.1 B12-binding domain-containing radical SAM protein [Methanothrix harundinacea]MDD5515673.1 radical SAM protein [Synergistales bacterium]MDI9398787.1 radical SAM protein [Euryarchaeota archaeon]